MKDKKLFLVWHDNGHPALGCYGLINQHTNFLNLKEGTYIKKKKPGLNQSLNLIYHCIIVVME